MRKVTAPTYIGYVDTVLDALLLFEACNLGILERAKQRPSPADRARFICSGSVFVWDEGQTGIRRWTDGRRWSSSRPRGNFIIYREL
ncbi:gluconate transport inducer 1/Pac2, partial [Syncephalis pseudoplumigaleata]